MQTTYSPDIDVMYIKFNDNDIEETIKQSEQVFLDVDVNGNLVGIEILAASKLITSPEEVQHTILKMPRTEYR